VTAKVSYEGNLHTLATHVNSGSTIETDAPLDNGGKGERFSPTDLVAAALATCMVTVMGIAANGRNMPLGRIECDVEKIMVPNPRRIGEIKVALTFTDDTTYSPEWRESLERIAMTCPVLESLHPDCKKTVTFNWPVHA
jgi:uncharacterized OsmC-like protein